MLIKQLSVFLENRSGRLTEVTGALFESQINIVAQCVAESSDFGILRMVVSNPELALSVLRAKGFSVQVTEVLCLTTPNTPGSLHRALQVLSAAGISIDYMYAFAIGDHAFVALRTTDVAKSIEVLRKHEQTLLCAAEICAGVESESR
jgi:hypothetical protein